MPFFFGVVFLALVLSVLAVVALASAEVSAFGVVVILVGFIGVAAGFGVVAGFAEFVVAGFVAAGVAGVVVDAAGSAGVVVDVVAGGGVVSSFTGVIAVVGSGSGLLCTVATKASMPSILPS